MIIRTYSAESDEVGRRARFRLYPRARRTQCYTLTRNARITRGQGGHRDARSEATLQTTLILTSCGGPIVGSGLWTLCSLNVPQRATARTLGVRVVFSQRGYLWSRGPRVYSVYTHTYTRIRALSAVRLLLKARCPRGIIHCERGASRKRNVGITGRPPVATTNW